MTASASIIIITLTTIITIKHIILILAVISTQASVHATVVCGRQRKITVAAQIDAQVMTTVKARLKREVQVRGGIGHQR